MDRNLAVKNIVCYHKNCSDGVAAATLLAFALDKENSQTIYYPISYKKDMDFIRINYEEIKTMYNTNIFNDKDIVLWFVDFSLDRKNTIHVSNVFKEIRLYDHHKSAIEKLEGLEDELPNFKPVYNLKASGAKIVWNTFQTLIRSNQPQLDMEKIEKFVNLISDRDLFLKETKEHIEAHHASNIFFTQMSWLPILDDALAYVELLCLKSAKTLDILDNIIGKGMIIDDYVKDLLNLKIRDISSIDNLIFNINGVYIILVNGSDFASNYLNTLCRKFNYPAAMWSVNEKGTIDISFRSLDHLNDVSLIAKSFGGGGHRNASGAELSFLQITQIYDNKVKKECLKKLEQLDKCSCSH